MRILVQSLAFYPRVGGLENVAEMLSREFVKCGHEVTVVTSTAGDTPPDRFPYRVVRDGSLATLVSLLRRCDIFVQFNISLKAMPALALVRRPWVISHQSYFCELGAPSIRGRLKRLAARSALNICCSHAVAKHVGSGAVVVPNPYDESVFYSEGSEERTSEALVVARLVSDKGVAVAVEAVHQLKSEGRAVKLTIVGDGPERAPLEAQVKNLGLGQQIFFTGSLGPREVAHQMRAHRILVVPSVWEEPFGIVALEGLASGCGVIASACGGLPEAVSEYGSTFPTGDSKSLAALLKTKLGEPRVDIAAKAREHLARHQSPQVAQCYLEHFSRLVRDSEREMKSKGEMNQFETR